MSFVLVQPSISSWLNDSSTASSSTWWSTRGWTAASVVMTASIVAIAGASIAAPLAIPPTVTAAPVPELEAGDGLLAHGVGGEDRVGGGVRSFVVRHAAPARASGCPTSTAAPSASGMPMSPVEHTRTSSGAQPRPAAVSSHMRRASRATRLAGRGVGVPRVEHDRGVACPSRRCSRLICTGAAVARFVVNTPAADTGRRVGGGNDREVGRARGLDAAGEPAGLEPAGCGDAHGIVPTAVRPVALGEAEQQVGALDRLTRRALDEVVERAEREDRPGALVEADGDVRGVRPQRRLGRRRFVDAR